MHPSTHLSPLFLGWFVTLFICLSSIINVCENIGVHPSTWADRLGPGGVWAAPWREPPRWSLHQCLFQNLSTHYFSGLGILTSSPPLLSGLCCNSEWDRAAPSLPKKKQFNSIQYYSSCNLQLVQIWPTGSCRPGQSLITEFPNQYPLFHSIHS